MKKSIIALLLFSLTLSLQSKAHDVRNNNVSELVLKAFQKDFIATSNHQWRHYHDAYIVDYIQGGEQFTAYYSTEGELQGFGKLISEEVFDPSIQKKLIANFKGYSIGNILEYYPTGGGKLYFVEIEKTGKNKVVEVDLSGKVNIIRVSK